MSPPIRRSIALAPLIEVAVREYQAKLMVEWNRSVSFTEALNIILNRILKESN